MNVSEGVDHAVLDELRRAAGSDLLDVHTDPHHHRSVFTMVGETAPRAVAELAVERIDLRRHRGVHPRLGIVDVVPFVPLAGDSMETAIAARNAYARWSVDRLQVPCFLYGPEHTLPEIRRRAWIDLQPDILPDGPARITAGASCVGARQVLVAYNVWMAPQVTIDQARRVANAIRGPVVRSLALPVGTRIQVSMNLMDPLRTGPAEVYDQIAALVEVDGAELVGLLPDAVLQGIDPTRWEALDVAADRTIEARLAARSA